MLKTSSSHEEGGERRWSVMTKRILGKNGVIEKLQCVEIEFKKDKKGTCPVIREVPGSEFEIDVDMLLLAIGFIRPEHRGLLESLRISFDERGNVKTDRDYMTSKKGIFSAGDMHRGQSLVVWAIYEGRQAAYCIDKYLMGKTALPWM